jgi:outer membrane protein assembly factor BamB
MVWKYSTNGEIASSPGIADGVVYVGSGDDNLYAMDALTGTVVWNYTTNGDIASSPAIADGIVYVGSYDGEFYALNAITGTYLWSYDTDDMVVSSPAVANGTVYVGSYDHLIYAFGPSTNEHDNAEPFPWTVFSLLLGVTALAVVLLAIVFYRKKHHE